MRDKKKPMIIPDPPTFFRTCNSLRVAGWQDASTSATDGGSEANSLLECDTTHDCESLTIDQIIDSVVEEAARPAAVRMSFTWLRWGTELVRHRWMKWQPVIG